MAVGWAVIPLLIGCGSLVFEAIVETPTPPIVEGEQWDGGGLQIGIPILVFFASLFFAVAAALGGLLVGIMVGLWAPGTEPGNPLRSPFFRRVGWQTFWVWLVIFIAALALGMFTGGPMSIQLAFPISYALSLGWHLRTVIAEELE